MIARRLLGYVVKLPDGTRSTNTPEPVPATEALRAALFDVPTGTHLVPVFAVRKPKPAPAEVREGRYAVLRKTWLGSEFCDLHYGDDTRAVCHVGARAAVDEAQRKSGRTSKDAEIVRILPDGAHEAAVTDARKSEREACAREFCEAMGAHPGDWLGVLKVAEALKEAIGAEASRRRAAAARPTK